ncbi:hypothetical protein ACLB2K_056487 [Fragaria x ananassa]
MKKKDQAGDGEGERDAAVERSGEELFFFLPLYSPVKPIPSDQSIAAPSTQPPPKPTPRRLHHKPDNLPPSSRASANLCKSCRGKKKKKREEGRKEKKKEEEEEL